MINHTISKIEAILAKLETPDKKRKAELKKLVASLKKEAGSGVPAKARRSGSVTKRLESVVSSLQASHPAVVDAVNEICRELATLGI